MAAGISYLGSNGEERKFSRKGNLVCLPAFSTLFDIARSTYLDDNGGEQYEYWIKLSKWVDLNDLFYHNYYDGSNYYENDRFMVSQAVFSPEKNGIVYSQEYFANGVYPKGVYGHYPQRPLNRPRKIDFPCSFKVYKDNKVKTLDLHYYFLHDTFEELDGCKPCYNEESNIWTYIGGSDDSRVKDSNGNFDINLVVYYISFPRNIAYIKQSKKWYEEYSFGYIGAFATLDDIYSYTDEQIDSYLISHGSVRTTPNFPNKEHAEYDYDFWVYDKDQICIRNWEIEWPANIFRRRT